MIAKKWVIAVLIIVIAAAIIGVVITTYFAKEAAPKIRVALVMPGAKDDKSWNEMAYHGLERIKDELGYETAYSEWVAPPDAETYIRSYATDGFNVILVHDFLMGDAMFKVAKDYPDIKFIWSGGFYGYWDEPAPNVYYWQILTHEGGYLAGWLAAGMTKAGIVGLVNAYPAPTLTASAEGFKQGVEGYNEAHGTNVRMLETYTYDWEDAAKAKETVISEVEMGADIIFCSGDHMVYGAAEACKELGVWYIGGIGDQRPLAPDVTITCLLWRVDNVFVDFLPKVLDGTVFSNTTYYYGLAEGGVELSPYDNFESIIPQELKNEIEQVSEDIKAGVIEVEFRTEPTPVS